jgi:carboxylesterase
VVVTSFLVSFYIFLFSTVNVTSRRETGYRVRVVDAEPFSLGPQGFGTKGVLVVHGFTGTPFEMRLMGDDLARRGFAVEGVRLAGHGGSARDLAKTTWHDWYASAETALARLKARVGGTPVAVAGLSMGGLVTLELARNHPGDIAAICVMSAPLWLQPQAIQFAKTMMRIPMLRRASLPKLAGSDIRDPELKKLNGEAQGRAGMPLVALASLVEFGEYLRDKLGDVKAPAILMHSELDHTVPFDNLDGIAHRIGSADYSKVVLHDSFHCITLDVERERVFNAAADWFNRYL